MLVFAIVVLLYNLAWPWAYETFMGRSWRFGQVTTHQTSGYLTDHHLTGSSRPQQADPTIGMSPEDKRLYERLVLRK
jgi:hypothetical protein